MSKHKLTVDVDLLKKYDRPGPRYTSYPTAPYFHEGVDEAVYRTHLQKSAGTDLSLYFHLPFCDTLCWFCGCNTIITQNRDKIKNYLAYLEKEMRLLRPLLGSKRRVQQLHWGGGTPTHLEPDEIRHLGSLIHELFEFTDDAEVSVEIDPRELTRDHMAALHEAGFRRCSMGVQDFDEKVQKAVNRVQPESITRQTIDWARELQFESINVDLMYGLPFQKTDSYEKTIEKVLEMDPDRLAVFNYAHLPQMIKHQNLIQAEWLPRPEEKLQLLKLSIEKLTSNGYRFIGMDHFAKPDDELSVALDQGSLYRNFQGYSTHAGLDMIAFGVTGIGMLSRLYVQSVKKLPEYYEALDAGKLPVLRGVELTEDDALRREVITEIMCNFKLTKAKIEEKYNIKFDSYFAQALAGLPPFEADGLLTLSDEAITIHEPGRLLIRNIAMLFDYYLNRADKNKPQFSRTV